MTELVVADKNGRVQNGLAPLANSNHRRRSSAPMPIMGEAFGAWAGRLPYSGLPGGAVMQFDLNRLTLADFRSMRDHYQLNASLSVLSFILHQIDWSIECEDEEIKTVIEGNLRDRWTTLIRGLSAAFWAGYSPMAINYDNERGYVVINKFKDLVPEECRVNWKEVSGWAPPGGVVPKFKVFDGIKQLAADHKSGLDRWKRSIVIPPENSVWYPLLMENGDHYGKKLLKPAFPSWFFSNLMHLFANRYYERFGEPTPLGRAPFDADLDDGAGSIISGKLAMENILAGLRNRAAVVLPNDRMPGDDKHYEYEIEYLESQMRGADFERYMSRLDEEMSLSVFTPVLLFRTADVGSYNLGQAHMKIFMQMVNSLAGDLKFYIQNYIVERLRLFNFGVRAPKAAWVYRKLGKDDTAILQALLTAVVANGLGRPDLEELGTAIGMTMHEVEQITTDEDFPEADTPDKDPSTSPTGVVARRPASLDRARHVLDDAARRLLRTVEHGKTDAAQNLGYRQRFTAALIESGADTQTAQAMTKALYGRVNGWIGDALPVVDDAGRFGEMLARVITAELDAA